MSQFLSAPVNEAQAERDRLLGALVGLSHTIVNEPKTEDTDRVLAEDWDEVLPAPVVQLAADCCAG